MILLSPKSCSPAVKYTLVFATVAVVVGLVSWATPDLIKAWAGPAAGGELAGGNEYSRVGAFGDQFGLANAVFSGLALAAVVVTLWMQRDELELQREELRRTSEAVQDQVKESRAQVAVLNKQNFEATFFQMLRLQEELRDSITWPGSSSGNVFAGRRALSKATPVLLGTLNGLSVSDTGTATQIAGAAAAPVSPIDQCRERYAKLYEQRLAERMGHMFRNLYVTLKFVDETTEINAAFYVRVLRSQMSQSELVLVFYNTISDFGREKMLPLAEKHNLFQNLSSHRLAHPSHREWVKSRFADDPPPGTPEWEELVRTVFEGRDPRKP